MAALLCATILVAIAAEDMVRFRIRNGGVLLLVVCFAFDAAFGTRAITVWAHLIVAGLGLAILLIPFVLGGIGGGDVKLLTAALLWIGPDGLFLFAVLLIVATLAYRAGSGLGWLPVRTRAGRTMIPFGASIAAAWLATIALGAG